MSDQYKNSVLEDAFIHLKHLPLLDPIHIEHARTAHYNEPEPETLDNFKIRSTNSDRLTWFEQGKFCQDLSKKFGVVIARYSKMAPATYYDWHQDLSRSFCINIALVQPPRAQTLHRKRINRLVFDIRECQYELLRPVLFNAQISHAVSNPADQYRYLLSISFQKSAIRWEEAKEWLLNYYTDRY